MDKLLHLYGEKPLGSCICPSLNLSVEQSGSKNFEFFCKQNSSEKMAHLVSEVGKVLKEMMEEGKKNGQVKRKMDRNSE
jgi:hypothetical protein